MITVSTTINKCGRAVVLQQGLKFFYNLGAIINQWNCTRRPEINVNVLEHKITPLTRLLTRICNASQSCHLSRMLLRNGPGPRSSLCTTYRRHFPHECNLPRLLLLCTLCIPLMARYTFPSERKSSSTSVSSHLPH